MQVQGGGGSVKEVIARDAAIRILVYLFSYCLRHVESAETNESVATTDCVLGRVGPVEAGYCWIETDALVADQ